MNMGTQGNPLNINLKHDHTVGKDAVGLFTGAWRSAMKYSVNSTLPIVAVNAWFQLSLAYVAAIIITHNDLSFITAIFNPSLMSAYALVSVIFGAVFLTSLALKHINKQEIKGEKSMDIKIRGGKPNEISEINEKAEKIEIIIKLDSKKKFLIILPISRTQKNILDGQIKENRNKVILLTIPYVMSAAVIIGALVQNRFNLANVVDLEEWSFIAFVSMITIVGICMAFYKLRNNEKNEDCDLIKKFDNLDILLPWRKGSITSVIKGQVKDQEENGPLTPIIRALREIGDKLCEIARKGVQGVENNFNDNINKFLKETKEHIKTLLDNLEKDIKQNVGEVKTTANKEITDCLRDIGKSVGKLCEEVSKDVKDKLNEVDVKKLMDLVSNLDTLVTTVEDRVARFAPAKTMGLAGGTFGNERIPNVPTVKRNSDEHYDSVHRSSNNQAEDDSTRHFHDSRIDELKKSLEELENKYLQLSKSGSGADYESSYSGSLDEQQDEETKLRENVEDLEKQDRIRGLKEKKKELEQKLTELPKQKEWKEKLDGKVSEFFNYVLESIKLKNNEAEGEINATLRDFDNTIIIHWEDGSKTTCYIKKQSDLLQPSTKIDFVDQNIQAAFAIACAG